MNANYTDTERRQWLIRKGYVPCPIPADHDMVSLLRKTDSEFVDHCISNGWCPAYYRPPQNLAEAKDSENGLVFVKKGDRERIDWAMAQ